MDAAQATMFGLCTNRNGSDWKLGWNVTLLTVTYSGMLASGLIFMFITLCVQMRDPLFVSAFNPLMLVIVAIVGSLLLNERLHLRSVLGAILIIVGLYIVLWGKSKELKKVVQLCPVKDSSIETKNGLIIGEPECSSFGIGGDGEFKHSSVQDDNDEPRRIANMVKTYPCPYSVTALTSIMGAAQATMFGLCTNRNWSDWKLGWNVTLLTVTYSGMLASGLIFMFITLCVQMRGPLFVSAFNPLMLVIVAIAGSLLLNERLHLRSVLGAIFIIVGLYIVLWGKSNELKKVAQLCPVKGSSIETKNGLIIGEPECSSFGIGGDGEFKHSSVQDDNDEPRRIVITS
ncbi:hypothetical protein OSB04_016321 [Centaurea solstitialis]|uniref:WAT1-related protein n=1 Tax=Centaurea solstitialis TaxID=347529 RepID=A0AA38WKY5_9ASTR|nr:hypothetical protein OSB04_016321 [Centaurea solstitialis]